MTITPIQALFLALLLIYAVPYLIWRIARLDEYFPVSIVQIVVGLLLGPGILGAVWPSYYQTLFSGQTINLLNSIAVWAASLFLFTAGVELDLHDAWHDRKQVAGVVGLAFGVPMIFGALAALGLLAHGGDWVGPHGASWQFALGLGMACAVTGLPILLLILEQLEILRTPLGQRVLRYASLDDVILWGTLAAILLDWSVIGKELLVLALTLVGAVMVRRVIVHLKGMDRWYLALAWLTLAAFGADWSGLHFMVGAFLAGAAIDASMLGPHKLDRLRDHVLLLIMPVFFLTTGLATRWDAGGLNVLVVAVILFGAQLAGKLLGVSIAGRMLGWPKGESYTVGWLLQTKSLVLLVFANILFERGIISGSAFAALVVMAVLSTVATIPAVRRRLVPESSKTSLVTADQH